MRGPKPMRVMVCGRLFESARAAAEFYNVTTSTVYWMIGKGRADRIGAGASRPMNGRNGKTFRAGPLVWPSMKEASLDLGFSEKYVERAVRIGRSAALQEILRKAMEVESRK